MTFSFAEMPLQWIVWDVCS